MHLEEFSLLLGCSQHLPHFIFLYLHICPPAAQAAAREKSHFLLSPLTEHREPRGGGARPAGRPARASARHVAGPSGPGAILPRRPPS